MPIKEFAVDNLDDGLSHRGGYSITGSKIHDLFNKKVIKSSYIKILCFNESIRVENESGFTIIEILKTFLDLSETVYQNKYVESTYPVDCRDMLCDIHIYKILYDDVTQNVTFEYDT